VLNDGQLDESGVCGVCKLAFFFLVDGVVFEMCRNSPDLVVGLLANCVVLEFGRWVGFDG